MASTAQTFANRENSKHSTGPRTPDGKAASSSNAKTHGLCAADPVLPHEDRAQFNDLLDQYRAEFAPTNIHADYLVAEMAGARWRLDRATRIENAMFAALESAPAPASADADAHMARLFLDERTGNGFTRLDRYRAGLERTYHRCARELRALAKLQKEPNPAKDNGNKLANLLHRMSTEPPPKDLREYLAQLRKARLARSAPNEAAGEGS